MNYVEPSSIPTVTFLAPFVFDFRISKALPNESLRRSSLWHRILSDFSDLEFTKYSDWLPGLAKALQRFGNSSPLLPLYAYGIWADSAIVDLC